METLIVTLTLTTVMSLLALLVGGMIGWMLKQHSYETNYTGAYNHPEMYDVNGNLVPDERGGTRPNPLADIPIGFKYPNKFQIKMKMGIF